MSKNKKLQYSVKCNAKINLFLYITGRRENGYHDICTLFVPISLCDTLTVTFSDSPFFSCSGLNIPVNEKNIVIKTDEILRRDYGVVQPFRIDLIKRIPIGAGLGGGSSNAAAYLMLVNKILSLALTNEQMEKIMLEVGSDTVFFLHNKTAIGRGLGEQLEFCSYLPRFYILIVNPNIPISTKQVYSSGNIHFTDEKTIPVIDKPLNFAETAALIKNDLADAVYGMHSEVADIVNMINALGHGAAGMSGSGATVFGIYENEDLRNADYFILKKEFPCYFIKEAEVVG